MSAEQYRREIQRHQDEIARLQRSKAEEAKRAADYAKRSADAGASAARASSASLAQSRLRDVERYESDKNRAMSKIADLEQRLAREHHHVADAQQKLAREEASERQREQRESDRRRRDQDRRDRDVSRKLSDHDTLHERTVDAIRRLGTLPQRIVVLLLAANPLNETQLRLDEEARAVAEMIRKAKHRDSVKLESCWAVRPQDVLQAINEHGPTIVHFSGHGSDQDEIVFQDDAGQAKLVSKEAIVQLMGACSSNIRLVFFNTCYSRNQAEAVVQHVEAAIGMRTSIGDDAARTFSSQFYSAIGFGLSIKRAFEQAKALVMMEGLGEEDTPELFTKPGLDPDAIVLVQPATGSTGPDGTDTVLP